VARLFFDEGYEQANREARDLIQELNAQSVRSHPENLMFILLELMQV
jgi:hypothetical protein